ncbi:MAG: SDR family NAD(P)-dependent oxidoreductase [Candidatus Vogelbacteria bacterium]|nr:SDR family NAD(P)-dependent oxidoreductase [Candidatus Vogelbacteria bacterium]
MKKALVTGASGGIGRAFAKALARDGYSITLIARSDDKLKLVQDELAGEGHKYIVADLAEKVGVEKISSEIFSTHYDLLINNAGAGYYDEFTKQPLQKWQQIMRLNCDSLLELTYAYLKNAKQGDVIVNIASILAELPYPPGAVYAASKAFVLSLTESLWYEQEKKGVFVLAVCPGVTETGFHVAAGGLETEKAAQSLTQTPDEVVEETMRALALRSGPTLITGWKNKLGLFLARFVTRRRLLKIMGSW